MRDSRTVDAGESTPGTRMQVKALAFKMVLEEDLLQNMLGAALSGPITSDSLARVMQCFGPCLQLAAGAEVLQQRADDGSAEGEKRAGVEVRSGEICNALATAASVGYVSSVRRPDAWL
jgi:hypothetical protein